MKNTCEEIWKPIEGYEGLYEVSSLGRVKSLPKEWLKYDGTPLRTKTRILVPRPNHSGYMRVTLRKDGDGKDFFIHRLVANAFIPNPNKYDFVNHKDENPSNNSVENLEWCTPLYNANYGTRNRRCALLRGCGVNQYDCKGNYICSFPTIRDAERFTGINLGSIRSNLSGEFRIGGGFVWKYTKYDNIPTDKLKTFHAPKNEQVNEVARLMITKDAYCISKDPNYITRKKAADYLSINHQIFDTYVSKLGIGSSKIGGFRYYNKKDVEILKDALKGIKRGRSKEKSEIIKQLSMKRHIFTPRELFP